MLELRGSLLGRVAVSFDPRADHLPMELSAAARTGRGALLVAADERATLELLQPSGRHGHAFGEHRSYSLASPLELAADAEIDLEGFAVDDDNPALFFVGSHSATRKKPKRQGHKRDLARLATVRTDPSRFVLGRVALSADGAPLLSKKGQHGLSVLPPAGDQSLLGLLAEDEHLAPFLPTSQTKPGMLTIPGKDNGFDVEGLAYFQGRLLIGLRGPVLRGWAFVLELELKAQRDGTLEVVAGRGKRPYRKHALDLDGLGVRELIVSGDDILVLAGPTMTLDGAHRVFRWRHGPSLNKDTVVAKEEGTLEPLFDVPFGAGTDRAEGATRFSWFDENDSLLVVYDTPGSPRRIAPSTLLADVFALDLRDD